MKNVTSEDLVKMMKDNKNRIERMDKMRKSLKLQNDLKEHWVKEND